MHKALYTVVRRAKSEGISKRTRFGVQKDSFWCAKGLLLVCKRAPFGGQKDSF